MGRRITLQSFSSQKDLSCIASYLWFVSQLIATLRMHAAHGCADQHHTTQVDASLQAVHHCKALILDAGGRGINLKRPSCPTALRHDLDERGES